MIRRIQAFRWYLRQGFKVHRAWALSDTFSSQLAWWEKALLVVLSGIVAFSTTFYVANSYAAMQDTVIAVSHAYAGSYSSESAFTKCLNGAPIQLDSKTWVTCTVNQLITP